MIHTVIFKMGKTMSQVLWNRSVINLHFYNRVFFSFLPRDEIATTRGLNVQFFSNVAVVFIRLNTSLHTVIISQVLDRCELRSDKNTEYFMKNKIRFQNEKDWKMPQDLYFLF